MKSGQLIVITGPSGVGKGTIVRSLLAKYSQIYLSISATTRKPRPREIDGKSYYFLTKEEFKEMIADNEFLEWAEYAGNYYGTPKQKVREQLEQGRMVLLEIEVVGATLVQQIFPEAVRIFILPPSLEVLEKRLRGRGDEDESSINKRLTRAKEEIAFSYNFEYQLVNDDLAKTLAEIEAIIFNNNNNNKE